MILPALRLPYPHSTHCNASVLKKCSLGQTSRLENLNHAIPEQLKYAVYPKNHLLFGFLFLEPLSHLTIEEVTSRVMGVFFDQIKCSSVPTAPGQNFGVS